MTKKGSKKGKKSAPVEEVVEEAPVVEEKIEEKIVDPVEEAPEKKKLESKTLYASKNRFKDWASGWTFNPRTDKGKPIDKMTPALKAAIKEGRIFKVE